MFGLSCVCYALVSVCLYVPCGHLLGKDWPLGSRLWCPTVIILSLSLWYPWSGVVLDCNDSWYLHPYLLLWVKFVLIAMSVCFLYIIHNFEIFSTVDSSMTSKSLCLLCLCARLLICALWSPAGKGLTSWLLFVVSNCEFVTFPL